MLVDRADDGGRLPFRAQASEADQDDACVDLVLPKDEFPEVLVRRKQQRLGGVRQREYIRVVRSRREFREVGYFVAAGPEPFDNLRIDALVGDELHDTSSDTA